VVIGLVTDIDARLARVKVRFPWLDMMEDSFWAPIASLLSGKHRGARFMPEVGDEALVAFEHGDFEHPFVLGFLWNGVDEAPDDVATNRVIVTPGGHELRFEDKDGDRRVVLKTKSGGTVTLLDQPGTAVIEASQNRITLGPGGIQVTAGTLNISSSATTTINATGAVRIKASGAVAIESSAMMSIKAAGLVSIKAGGAVSVTAPTLHVKAALASFTGVVQASTVVAAAVVTTSVVSTSYTPGAGNLI
jgi:uncharacterized protein involved in type VI secretion and phage assembly